MTLAYFDRCWVVHLFICLECKPCFFRWVNWFIRKSVYFTGLFCAKLSAQNRLGSKAAVYFPPLCGQKRLLLRLSSRLNVPRRRTKERNNIGAKLGRRKILRHNKSPDDKGTSVVFLKWNLLHCVLFCWAIPLRGLVGWLVHCLVGP